MEVDRRLIKIMHKYYMIFPTIEMTAGLDKLNERYKIGEKK